MKEVRRQLFDSLGLLPIVVELLTNLTAPLRPPPPLDTWASWAAGAFALLSFAVTMAVTWKPRSLWHRRLPNLLALASAALFSMFLYYFVSHGFPQHSLLLDILQVCLWGLFFAFMTTTLTLGIDTIALKYVHRQATAPSKS